MAKAPDEPPDGDSGRPPSETNDDGARSVLTALLLGLIDLALYGLVFLLVIAAGYFLLTVFGGLGLFALLAAIAVIRLYREWRWIDRHHPPDNGE